MSDARLAALAATLASLGACGSAPTCEEMVNHLVVSQVLPPAIKADRVGRCERARPAAPLRACLMSAATTDDVETCRYRDEYPDEPLRMMHRRPTATDEDLLKKLAARAIDAHYPTGQFPAANAGPVPPLAAACAPGDRTSQPRPPDPVLWRGAPWDALQFAVTAPSRASFQYEVVDAAREVVVRAWFDLDCDGAPETAAITVRVESGEPRAGDVVTDYPSEWNLPPPSPSARGR